MFQVTSVQIRFTILCDPAAGRNDEKDIVLIKDHRQLLTTASQCSIGRTKLAEPESLPGRKAKLQLKTVHLHLLRQPCDYPSLMYFVLHFVKLPHYRTAVISKLQSTLTGVHSSSSSSSAAGEPVRAVLHFTVPNCDVHTPVDKSW